MTIGLKSSRVLVDTGIVLTLQQFMLLFAGGAAAIALWIAVRFPSLAPQSVHGTIAAVAAAALAPVVGAPAVAAIAHLAGGLIALFAIALPILVFMFLTGAWTALFAQRHLRPS